MTTEKPTAPARDRLTAEEYTRAEELWPTELLRRVTNAVIVPTWLDGEDRFWFKHEHRDGHEYVLLDATTGERRPAFDHDVVARALGAEPRSLPVETFEYDGEAIVAVVAGREGRVRIDKDGSVSEAPMPAADAFRGPDGQEAFVRDHNLWVRDGRGFERQLTTGGVEHFGWAEAPDNDYDRLGRVGRDRAGAPHTTQGCFWSPDGRRLFVARVDERRVRAYPYLESVTHDGSVLPRVHRVRRKLFGDAEETRWLWHVIDAATGEQTVVDPLPDGLLIQPWHCWWTEHGTVLALAGTFAQDAAALVEIDAATGSVRVVHLEHDHMFRFNNIWFHDDNVRYLPERGQFIWFTFEDGWPHLWVIDVATGAPRQLTAGEWVVQDLVRVTDRHAFFTTGGTQPGANPYLRRLHRVDLDGDGPNAGLACLTPEDADHAFPPVPQGTVWREWGAQPFELRSCVSPSGRYFVDNISRVDLPTVTLLRDGEGNTVTELARADISGLEELGWRFPETFRAKAADGKTDVWGVIVKPRRFDDGEPWPVIERIYGGHQVLAQPRSFLEGLNGSFMFGLHALADLGFVVVVLDGPGTPVRSRAFRDMTWDHEDRFGIAHHRAAIEELARSRPWMDISSVGVNGHSSGGYATLMCLLLEPDFYKVGFCSSPALGADGSQAWITEAHFGRPDYGDGRTVRLRPDERAPSHTVWDPATHVDRLQGRLMLVYGDIDEECEPPVLLQFLDKLVQAGKDFDLLPMPGRSHYYTTEPYYQKRLWDYFVEHVQGRTPLRHHRLGVTPGRRLSET
ncbi:putative dipeptidyl peptidase IV [Streptomyces viridiviolaceus]|uniref:Prolyl oligopeptidase family serine peptidase n=1 Tax=Streptomyces viridiviolaceus TaxID=68282 RepID=A0ABW2E6Y5_9ACTN|nr:prolyl oligopeptidase family serine peptidase [Streptomyces viridiviolaceus]GHB56887.1 putative dipeptidyl peptidase IV [Streptomyces viridiviolaceus]